MKLILNNNQIMTKVGLLSPQEVIQMLLLLTAGLGEGEITGVTGEITGIITPGRE